MVATYVPPAACSADKGDLFTLLGIMNKQDYARWHSCEFVLGAKTFDPSLRPPGHPEVCMPFLITPVLLLSALRRIHLNWPLCQSTCKMLEMLSTVAYPAGLLVITELRAVVLLWCGSPTLRHYAGIEKGMND